MKPLKITVLLAASAITLSALSVSNAPTTSDDEQTPAKYQQLKKESTTMTGMIKKDKKPPTA